MILDSIKLVTFGALAVSAQMQMEESFVPGQNLASIATACANELQSCGINVSAALSNPAEVYTTIDFATVRPCLQNMMQELMLLPTLPEGNTCVDALRSIRRPGGGGAGGGAGDRFAGRASPCLDSSFPTCASGDRPRLDFTTRTLVCQDGTSAACADGSSPELRPGGVMQQGGANGDREFRASPCPDSSFPTCASGDRPRLDFATRTLVCQDGTSAACADGSSPELRPGGFMQQGGANGARPFGGLSNSFGASDGSFRPNRFMQNGAGGFQGEFVGTGQQQPRQPNQYFGGGARGGSGFGGYRPGFQQLGSEQQRPSFAGNFFSGRQSRFPQRGQQQQQQRLPFAQGLGGV